MTAKPKDSRGSVSLLLADVIKGWDTYCEKTDINFATCDRVSYKNMGHAFQAGVKLGARLASQALRARDRRKRRTSRG